MKPPVNGVPQGNSMRLIFIKMWLSIVMLGMLSLLLSILAYKSLKSSRYAQTWYVHRLTYGPLIEKDLLKPVAYYREIRKHDMTR